MKLDDQIGYTAAFFDYDLRPNYRQITVEVRRLPGKRYELTVSEINQLRIPDPDADKQQDSCLYVQDFKTVTHRYRPLSSHIQSMSREVMDQIDDWGFSVDTLPQVKAAVRAAIYQAEDAERKQEDATP